MTRDEEVRAMEIATKLVDNLLSWAQTGSINAIGEAIVDLALQVETVEDIRAVGELLEALTERDRKAIARGEKWGKRSRLTGEDGQKVLWSMTMDQLWAFAQRWEYDFDAVIEWAREQRDIPHGALIALGDVDEMAKITGGER